jgi:hypothetical protein
LCFESLPDGDLAPSNRQNTIRTKSTTRIQSKRSNGSKYEEPDTSSTNGILARIRASKWQNKKKAPAPRPVIYQGLLDFDQKFEHLHGDEKRQVPITLVYPSEDFQQK